MAPHRNWNEIARLEDGELMMLVVTTKDADTFAGLQRGFPHLFTDEPAEFDGAWPRAVVTKAMVKWSNKSGITPDDYLRKNLGLPVVSITDLQTGYDHAVVISTEELDRLMEGFAENIDYFNFEIVPPIITLSDGRRFYVLQRLPDDIIAVLVKCVDCG